MCSHSLGKALITLMLLDKCSYAKVMDMLKDISKDIVKDLNLFLKEKKKEAFFFSHTPFLYNNIVDFVSRKGKKIRPVLFVLSYLGYSKKLNIPYKKLIRSSLSMELLHDFMLIHDDVIDKSTIRRGKPSLHRLYNKNFAMKKNHPLGQNLSIITGDILFSLAIEALLAFDGISSRKEKALALFTQTAASTAIGEYLDVISDINSLEKVTEKEISLTYRLKTAKYTFASPIMIGALLAGAKNEEYKRIEKLGGLLGNAFQIQDDLLDIFSTSKKTGKPIFSDLAESKKTFLVWKTYKTLSPSNKIIFKKLFNNPKKSKSDFLNIKKLIEVSGAHHFCIKKTNTLFTRAEKICTTLEMKNKHKKELLGFISDLKNKSNLLDIE